MSKKEEREQIVRAWASVNQEAEIDWCPCGCGQAAAHCIGDKVDVTKLPVLKTSKETVNTYKKPT